MFDKPGFLYLSDPALKNFSPPILFNLSDFIFSNSMYKLKEKYLHAVISTLTNQLRLSSYLRTFDVKNSFTQMKKDGNHNF